ncbi:hypothetical protein FPQ18DRAFT_310842 [Pyronema domesticum]|nr:hypothetical protein FPQ18DRAFT_310842 [Pyronema domesticum]
MKNSLQLNATFAQMSPRAGAMTAIIRDLTDGSAFLSNQKNQIFNIWKILEAPGVEVIDFYDTRDTKTVELDFPLLWLVGPEKCRIREAVNSYIISDKVPAEESIFYCQWSSSGQGTIYEILGGIGRSSGHTGREIAPHDYHRVRCQTQEQTRTESHIHKPKVPMKGSRKIVPNITPITYDKERKEYLKLLTEKFSNTRYKSIAEEDPGSLRIWSNKEFELWLKSDDSRLLHIEGKPRSGKSTIMMYLRKKPPVQTIGDGRYSLDPKKQADILTTDFFYSERHGEDHRRHEK